MVASYGYSALTLAALEDSGWYRADYAEARPLLWGREAGCDFAEGRCVSSSGIALDPAHFCVAGMEQGCTADGKARGFCNLVSHR